MVAGLQIGGRLVPRFGTARLLTAPAIGLGWSLAAVGWSTTMSGLISAAGAFGLVHGLFDVASNSAAVRCQDAYGRPIMAGLHSAYSCGISASVPFSPTQSHADVMSQVSGSHRTRVLRK